MRDYDAIEATARPGSAFSNGTEWDCWSSDWCNQCVHDQDIDSGGCPIVLLAMQGEKTPAEWVPGPTDEEGRVSLTDRYGCLEFQRVPD